MITLENSELLERYIASINDSLLFFTKKEKGVVGDAERYCLRNYDNRELSIFALITSQIICGEWQRALLPAIALEMIKTASVIHDDLPFMNNNDSRNNKPACHKQYNENIALLAGDALVSKAFQMISEIPDSEVSRDCARILSDAVGNEGMIHGRELDFEYNEDLEAIKKSNAYKTTKLITAAILVGAKSAKLSDQRIISALTDYSYKIGEVVKVIYDISDIKNYQNTTGSSYSGKANYASLLGVEDAALYASKLTDEACDILDSIDINTEFLKWYSKQILMRIK